MLIEGGQFLAELMSNPGLILVTLMTIGVIVVNGATDAPNAIATVVGTRCLSPNASIIMAAVCNFLGLLLITFVSSAVADTIYKMVDFGGDTDVAMTAILAAMVAIIVWGVATWLLGIPTSESHALIAGISGAAIALQGSLSGINWDEWIKVVYGLLLSTFLGFGLGWLTSRVSKLAASNAKRKTAEGFFGYAQIVAAGGVAFMHGAQDGQKFMSVFILAAFLATGAGQVDDMVIPLWLVLFCSITMGLGTAIGGRRIIKSVGIDMVKMEKYQGFAASLSGVICIGLSTFLGLPVSTTHTKTIAIMGVGAEKRVKSVKWALAGDMAKAWVLTFPGCGLLGFGMAKLFFLLF